MILRAESPSRMHFPPSSIPYPKSFTHAVAILAGISQKLGLDPKLDQSRTDRPADYWDAKPERSRPGSRQDAALAIHPPGM
jgi:hypothetical protein